MTPDRQGLTILHESGAWRHYEALIAAAGARGMPVRYCTLNYARRLSSSLRRLRPAEAVSACRDAGRLVRLLVGRSRIVIAGVAPYGLWGILIWILRRRHRVIYHSSWPRWRLGRVPRNANHRSMEWLWRRALRGIQAVCVTSQAARGLSEFGAMSIHIPHAVDLQAFYPEARPTQNGKLVMLFVGRIVEEKGIALIVAAARRLHRDNPGIEWWFAGTGPLEADLAKEARAGVPIRHLGYLSREDLADAYRSSDVLVLPSVSRPGWEELFGIALIEAFACGLPVIASDCTGPAEIVDDGRTGLLIAQGDEEALYQAVKRLCGDARLREEMGQRCREQAESRYALSLLSDQWSQLL